MHKKILTTFWIIVFTVIVLNINNVFGYDVVSQAWKTDVDGRPYLLFRTYTTPHSNTVTQYHNTNSSTYVDKGIIKYIYNGKDYTSKWIYTYNNNSVATPRIDQFQTIAFGFHKAPMCTYTVSNKNNSNSIGYNVTQTKIDYDINTITKAYEESSAVYAIIENKITDRTNYKDEIFYSVLKNGGTYSTMNWGTQINVKNLYTDTPTEYRYSIVEVDGENVYVADNMIYGDDIEGFVTAAKQNGCTNSCYVTKITISKTYGNNTPTVYEVSLTSKDFYLQHDKMWGSEVKGKGDTKAMGSAVNLFDNILEFPQLTNRTVLVRHINIGNSTTVSEATVNRANNRIGVSNLREYLSLIAGNKTISATTSTSNTTYTGTYEEYYENKIDVEDAISKSALPDSTNKYKCIGYNVGVALDEDSALAIVNDRIKAGQYTSGKDVYVAGKSVSSDSDVVVIDFYYSEYDKDVEVNHVYVNKTTEKVVEVEKQTIIPNNTATMGGITINRNNDDYYVKETYSRKLGQSITVDYAKSLKDKISSGEVNYHGYEILEQKTDISSLVGKQINVDKLNTGTQANISGDSVQVNFYYYVENIVYVKEPDRDIGGELFIDTSSSTAGTCKDDDDLAKSAQTVISVPTESKVKIGIASNKNENSIISRYMVGAITTEKVASTENNLRLKLNISIGKQSITVDTEQEEYQDLKYRASYYKVTDMVVYRLINLQVYDAQQDGGIFSWNSKTLNPTNQNLRFALSGLLGTINEKDSLDIDDINNYVGVSITYKDIRTGEIRTTKESTTSANLDIPLLGSDEYDAVDANGEGGITDADREYAKNTLAEYLNILENKKTTEASLTEQYNNALKNRAQLEENYRAAEAELNRRHEEYISEDEIKSGKLQEKTNAENDLKNMERELETKQKELEELELTQGAKKQTKLEAESNLLSVTQIKESLYSDYQEKLEHRNQLAQLAQCQDTVEDDVYIYLEEDEKEALEQCKLYKQEYQDNKDNKVVEVTWETYESYLNNEYAQASNEVNDAVSDYNTASQAVSDKQKEISTLQINIKAKEFTVEIIAREYNKYINEVYTPIKDAYYNYLDGEYANAKKAYTDNVDNQVVENVKEQLDNSTKETQAAQTDYDEYLAYKNNLDNHFDEYKDMYDLYMSLVNADMKTIAEKLGLNINIRVQNMLVSIYKNNKYLASLYTDETSSEKANLSTYTESLSTYLSSNIVPEIKTDRPIIQKEIYSGIASTELTMDDYTQTDKISKNILNGVRVLSGKVDYEAEVVIGSSKSAKGVEDTIYFSDQSDDNKTVAFKLNQTELSKTYEVNKDATTYEEKYEDVKPINIYTPITVSATLKSNEDKIVDQTKESVAGSSMIQVNTPFTITLDNGKYNKTYNNTGPYSISNTKTYRYGYYVKFDFDVHNVYINGTIYRKGDRIPADTWIGIITPNSKNEYATITAQAYGNIDDDSIDVVSEEKSNYTVRAVSYNASQIMLDKSISYTSIAKMIAENSGMDTLLYNICDTSSYFAEETYDVTIINRLYEFRITDVKDINWKTVFRKTSGSSTNAHTGIVYYSGTTKWNTKLDKSNDIITRSVSEIGKNPLRILPLGPYKNTDVSYIKAPKIGYRFSFDFKITGSYYTIINTHLVPNEEKTVEIATRFYYISKDGKKYYSEYDPTSETKQEGIYLFYKTNDGRYVRIDENGGGYNLTFTPNDGYRYIGDNDTSNLSKKSVSIGNLRNLVLTYEMATPTNNRAATTYYGEYKLPNSTIAVYVDKNGNYDINSPLKDGYVGVIFDITANNNGLKLQYSEQTNDEKANTSQWDYEGFLGFTNYGSPLVESLGIKLEKGSWKIDNKIYNEIKGSVILYDIDERAATDYE